MRIAARHFPERVGRRFACTISLQINFDSHVQASSSRSHAHDDGTCYSTVDEVNSIPNGVLELRVSTYLLRASTEPRPAALARIVTKELVARIFVILGDLDKEARGGFSKQAALARVVNDITRGSLPDDESLEYAGQYMWDAVCRPKKTYQARVVPAVLAAKRKASEATMLVCANRVAELHREVYHCEYGCTTPEASAVRKVPQQRAPRSDLDIDRDRVITGLQAELVAERQKPDSAKRERERADVAVVEAAEARAEADAALQQLKVALVAASEAASEAALELATDMVDRAEAKAAKAQAKLETEITARRSARKAATTAAAELKSGRIVLQGQVVGALMEAAREAEARLTLQADFEAEVERRVQQEMPQLREEIETELKDQIADAEETSAARKKRERAEKRRATESAQRLERAKAAELDVEALKCEIDALHEKLQHLAVEHEAASDDEQPCGGEAARDKAGRMGKFDWKTRRLFHRWLSRRTPPVTAGRNYMDAARHFAPELKTRQPSLNWIRNLRAETTILGEACAALQVLCAKRIISFGFDESTKRGDGVASTNIQIETMDGEVLDVVLRGAFVIPGGTAEQVSAAMESKLFAHCRKLLRKWKEVYERMCGKDTWPYPDPSRLGYHQLGGALIMSDTCNAARAAKRLIMEQAARAIEDDIGAEAWAKLSADEKAKHTQCYVGDCMQHLRNIFLDAMHAAATKHLTLELEESLEAFSSYERMSTDVMQLIRAVYKELHHTGEYAKGKQREFEHWLLTHHPSAFFMPLERANGGRQDLAFDGSVPIFANRLLISEFLHTLVFVPGHSNILEDFIWHSLACVEMVALTRANTLFDLLLSAPLRWLCGKGSQLNEWSVYKAGVLLDLVEELLIKAADNGAVLFDPEQTDIFASIAAEQPLFQAWRDELQTDTVPSPDGKTHHPWHRLTLSEAQTPTNKSNVAATDATIDLIQAMAVAGLNKMRDPRIAISDWLTSQDGSKSFGKNALAHLATLGAHTTNCRVESNFGGFDNVLRTFESICIENASGIAQQMRMHHFDSRTDHVVNDRGRKVTSQAKAASSSVGLFDTLSEKMQEAGIEMARVLRPEARVAARADRKEQAEYRSMQRAANLQSQLEALATKGSLALERFEEYTNGQAVFTPIEMVLALAKIPALTNQQTFLRRQIEMRVYGIGWRDLATTWQHTGESLADSVSRLKGHLKDVLIEESVRTRRGEIVWKDGKLVEPSEAALPDFEAKSRKQLGTRTADAEELSSRALCSPEQIAAASQRERERREAAGFTDAVQMVMPQAPTLPLAVGTQLEVCWGNYISTIDNKSKVKMWCPCKVLRTADGEKDKGRDGQTLSLQARKLAPRGMVLLEWEPDPERGEKESTTMWLLLDPRPGKWNGDGHRAWRYHPNHLAAMQCAREKAKQPRRA